MIDRAVLCSTLDHKLTFKSSSISSGLKAHRKLRKMNTKYDLRGFIPEDEILRYIRLNINAEFGSLLSKYGIPLYTIDLEKFGELNLAWNNPMKFFLKE